MNPDQWNQLVEAIKARSRGEKGTEAFLDYCVVMRQTGCRPQEIRIVEARHIDHSGKRWVFDPEESKGWEKSGNRRIVNLSEEAYQICHKLALKTLTGPIFRNSNDKPWNPQVITNRFQLLSKDLGFKVFAYALRHTFATEALLNGADVITVARLLGHSDLTMLNSVYQHVTRDRAHLETAIKKATARVAS